MGELGILGLDEECGTRLLEIIFAFLGGGVAREIDTQDMEEMGIFSTGSRQSSLSKKMFLVAILRRPVRVAPARRPTVDDTARPPGLTVRQYSQATSDTKTSPSSRRRRENRVMRFRVGTIRVSYFQQRSFQPLLHRTSDYNAVRGKDPENNFLRLPNHFFPVSASIEIFIK